MVVRRILGTVLAGTLAIVGLQATPAFADAGTTRTFGFGELCTTAGEVTYDAGKITIDLSKLAPAITEVEIAGVAVSGCRDQITSLNWTGSHPLTTLTVGQNAFSQNNMVSTLASVSFPANLESLQIGDRAFLQQAMDAEDGGGSNKLASVAFPVGLKSLSIGNAAFFQNASLGDNALVSLTFPSSLTSLSIGSNAFQQGASGANSLKSVDIGGDLPALAIGTYAFLQSSGTGDNALSSVTFAPGLSSLVLGYQAFYQSAPHGKNALTSIVFPSGLTTLDIGGFAFWQDSSSGGSLSAVRFPGSLTSLTIGAHALDQSTPSALTSVVVERFEAWPASPAHNLSIDASAFANTAPTWLWFGPDGTSLSSAWNGTITSPAIALEGYRILTFDNGDGSAPATWYVYPDGGHVTKLTVEGDIGPGSWTAKLPSASRDGYSLAGWCTTSASSCPSLLPAGGSYTLAAASQALYARWTLNAPKVVSSLIDGVVGAPYRASVATGAELTCSSPDVLPPGLSLSGCELTGTPSTPGSYPFTVTATNSAGSPSGSLTLVVHNAPPTITTAALSSGTVTVPYSASIAVSGGGTITCAVTAGSLPPGLALTGCALTGTPTKAGSYPFTLAASNDGGTGLKAFTLVVAAAKKFTTVHKPTISGTAKVGKTLKAKVKTWKPKPATIAWQWYRNSVAIPGATKAKYKLTSADKRAKITVKAVCTRVGYQSWSTSKSTAKVK